MLSTIASVFPPGWRVMLSSAAGFPSPEMISVWSTLPSVTVATSRTRKPLAITTAPISSGV